jgi:hypothetical protein
LGFKSQSSEFLNIFPKETFRKIKSQLNNIFLLGVLCISD